MAPEALAPGVADVSHLESLEMKCKLFYELFCTTEDPTFLQAIKDAVIDACPTLRFGPHAKDEGEAAFLAFDVKTPLNDERIANLIEIVKPLVPDAIQLEPDFIRAIHEVMCSEKIDEQTLGQLFPHSALVFFLEFCHVNIELPYEKDSLVEGVRHAFRASQIHARHSIGSTLPSTPLNNGKQAEDGVFLSYKRCLATIVKYIEHVQQQGRKLAQESALAADGILKYRSMEDLKRRFYEVNDIHEMELLVSQIHRLHVAETATRLNALLRLFDDMVKVINEFLQGK